MFAPKINWAKMMKDVGGRSPRNWTPEETVKFIGAINAYLKSLDPRAVADAGRVMSGMMLKAWMASGMKDNIPTPAGYPFTAPGAGGGTPLTQAPDPFMIERYITGTLAPDLGYEKIYKPVDMRGTRKDHFTIDSATTSITWQQVDEGEKVSVGGVSDKQLILTVYYLNFMAAIGFLDDWWEFEWFWKMDDVLEQFRLKRQMLKTKLAYGLIEALGKDGSGNVLPSNGVDFAFDTNLITTIDNACIQMVYDIEYQGYGLPDNPSFVILTPPECFKAIAFALDSLLNPFAQAEQKVSRINYSIDNIITTRRLQDKSHFYVVMPFYQTKMGTWMDLQMEGQRDIFKKSEEMVGKEQYNFGIGNPKQFKRLPMSA